MESNLGFGANANRVNRIYSVERVPSWLAFGCNWCTDWDLITAIQLDRSTKLCKMYPMMKADWRQKEAVDWKKYSTIVESHWFWKLTEERIKLPINSLYIVRKVKQKSKASLKPTEINCRFNCV